MAEVKYVRRRGMKRITLSVKADGRVFCTYPYYVSKVEAERVVESRSDFIENALKKYSPYLPQLSEDEKKKTIEDCRGKLLTAIPPLIEKYAAEIGEKMPPFKLDNARSRWACCRRNGQLSFSVRCGMLPDELLEYIVVHELCHLRHFNHGPEFKALLTSLFPDRKACERELKIWSSKAAIL